ncbi:MAG: T9SS type A sorting domain-containing protein, partial [Bacteroidia bacterium]
KLPWTANYYGGIDVKLIAAPKNPSLYAFSNYTSASNINFVGGATNDSVSINAVGQDTITAHFNNIITNVKSIETKALSNAPVTTVYPTVFTAYTNFNFYLPTNSKVQIVLKDMNGKTIQLLNNGLATIAEGDYNLTIDLQKSNLSKGTYLLYFKADNYTKTHKIVYQ